MRTFHILLLFSSLSSIFLLGNCAKIQSPKGGPKDVLPPKLDTALSSPFAKTNFSPRELVFYFDEYVEVKNAYKEVFISPSVVYNPQIISRGKKVKLKLDKREVLKENATYNINFGNSIVDFHEGNILKNFTYFFSTGDKIDSLEITGKVVNAITNEPEKNFIIGLYRIGSDTIISTEKPIYLARLTEEGKFQFRYIAAGDYSLVAINDKNLNFKYDKPSEEIAFAETDVNLPDSTTFFTLTSSFPNQEPKIISKQINTFGKATFIFNQIPDTLLVDSNLGSPLFSEKAKDSVHIYYSTELDSFKIFVHQDTFNIRPKNKEAFLKKHKLEISKVKQSDLLVTDTFKILMNAPFTVIDSNKIKLKDSLRWISEFDYNVSGRTLQVVYPWKSGRNYSLKIDSAAIRDIYGSTNDTLKAQCVILAPKDLCQYELTVKDLDEKSHYTIHVLKRDGSTFATATVQNDSTYTFHFKGIRPDQYDVEIFEDSNMNNKWDPGDYFLKRQPETYKRFKGEKLRADKDSEKIISWKEAPNIDTKTNTQKINFSK
ncbi:MAG: Ig-like domain-containing protein [Saprospiraceae bacterium]|nr:Ig-like domain-containing protein [Saprospiraceae bacterium]